MIQLSRPLLARARAPMGLCLPTTNDNVPIIKFPAAFKNFKKVMKNLRYENSLYVGQFAEAPATRPAAKQKVSKQKAT